MPDPDIVRARGDARDGRDPPEEFLDRLSVNRFGLNLFFGRPRGNLGLIGEAKVLFGTADSFGNPAGQNTEPSTYTCPLRMPTLDEGIFSFG